MGQPTIIYVKNFVVKDEPSDEIEQPQTPKNQEVGKSEFKDSEKQTSSIPKNRIHEVGNSESNYIEINNTEKSYIEHRSFYPPAEAENSPQKDFGTIDRLKIEKSVEDQIGYDCLMSQPDESVRNMITEIKDLIVDVMSGERNVFVGGQRISDEAAKSAFSKLTDEHVMYVLHNLTNYPERISRIDRFLLTSLYNAAYTYTNSVFAGIEYNTGIRLIE